MCGCCALYIGNTIENVSRIIRTYTPAIRFNGVGLLIRGNRIAHTPHTALTGASLVEFGVRRNVGQLVLQYLLCIAPTGWGNNHIFENNYIYHTCFASDDCGSWYMGRSWAERGNVVRFNTFDIVRATERLGATAGSQQALCATDAFVCMRSVASPV